MNRPETPRGTTRLSPTLAEIAFAVLAEGCAADTGAEAAWLESQSRGLASEGAMDVPAARSAWNAWNVDPPEYDRQLHALAGYERLSLAETLALALGREAELVPMAARALIWLQHPVGEARPTVGLIASLCERLGEREVLASLADGPARRHGMIRLHPDERPLCERSLRLAQPLLFALGGRGGGCFDGVDSDADSLPPLPESTLAEARRHGAGLLGDGVRTLLIRSGQALEARAAAARVAAAVGARAVFFEGEAPTGLGPWLWLSGCLPVWCVSLAPGERRLAPRIAGHQGPLLVACGLEGSIEAGGAVAQWRLSVPAASERHRLWRSALGAAPSEHTIAALAAHHRHGAGRIAELGQAARSAAARCGEPLDSMHVTQVARSGVGADLGALAELLSDDIPDAALVLTPALRTALEALLARCRLRDTLADGLGAAACARYRPGVRALLVGPSGTGKTLAASWVATRLGLPIYRVDLASVTSKYIGETEKNLSELFARAEHAEVVLLFDEADSLFGKRTDVKDANDRFANQQTNYLLQRIESFEGIVLLTSNSRARFDSAFTRRLDAILEFPTPGPEERRALWLAHLGETHGLDAAALNRLAAACDLAGGHIRNVVLAAAALARQGGTALDEGALLAAIAAEYRKLGKPLPAALGLPA
ncbi:MAG: AAA family ATPase [Candidatus Accumulibacter phosphatis]|uniref:AAA family ATPase n=1 Tax=Candidatus Accumulibacter phosphatis TaxID=327160 RepID=A0A6A7RUU5_9PROT|nr:AAA family ATPase [Candidatus Accumulibacter phosphatis]